MERNEKKSFMLYHDWAQFFELLRSDEERGKLIMALFAHALGKREPELTGEVNMAFRFMSVQLDRDLLKWEDTRLARSEAGKRGGAPKGNQNARKYKQEDNSDTEEQTEQTEQAVEEVHTEQTEEAEQAEQALQAKQAVTVKDTVTVTDTVTVKDKVTVTDTVKEKPRPKARTRTSRKKAPPQKTEGPMFFGTEGIITMHSTEYDALCAEFGKARVDYMIARMNDYCLAKGVDYKSYAMALRRWIHADDEKEKARTGAGYQRDDTLYYDIN